MTLAERFASSRGEPIELNGHVVNAIYRHDVDAGQKVRLRWLQSVDEPVQGVSITVKKGAIRVAGSKTRDLVLWTDTAPQEVEFSCDGRGTLELLLWNCWRDRQGVTQAWVGNGGMIIEPLDDRTTRFNCNSKDDLTFKDLVFELVFVTGLK